MTLVLPKPPNEAMYVEAAAWVVRLHGPNRSPTLEAGLRRWLAEHTDHRQAFELATETWNSTRDIAQPAPSRLRRWIQARPGMGTTLAAAAGAAGVAILVGVFVLLRAPRMQTNVGEQRTLRLADGTQVALNTDTRLTVHYDAEERRIELERGEALFDVAGKSHWPFVVNAGDRSITALGTAFVVRREERQLAVTLVEGKIAVSSEPKSGDHSSQTAAAGTATVMVPGQRLTFDTQGSTPKIDRPNLEKTTAWRRGLVMLEDTPLAEAIVEMNRYSTIKLVIEQPRVATLEVSGMFRAGDSMRFARAVAKTYQLVVVEQPDRIVLAGAGVN